MGTPRLVSSSLRLSQQGFKKTATALYRCAYAESLSDVSLEEGDVLPYDSTYEILTAEQAQDRSSQDKVVAVSAYAEVYEHTALNTSKWSELGGTRKIMQQTMGTVDWEAQWSATTALTAANYPVVGDLASTLIGAAGAAFGTAISDKSLDGEPQAMNVGLVREATPSKRHVTVQFRGYFVAHSGQTPWQEIQGTRKLAELTPEQVTWTADFVGTTTAVSTDKYPSRGNTITTLCGASGVLFSSTTFGALPLDGEAQVVVEGAVANETPDRRLVTVQFQSYFVLDSTHSPWMEVMGTRKIVADTNEYRDWQISFTGGTAAAQPLNGETYGSMIGNTATPLDTTGSTTTFDVQPVIVQVGHIQEITPIKSFVTCTFRENYLDTTTN